MTGFISRLHEKREREDSDNLKVSSAFGKIELPFTKMEKTQIGADLGGETQFNLALLGFRCLVGIQGVSRVEERDGLQRSI